MAKRKATSRKSTELAKPGEQSLRRAGSDPLLRDLVDQLDKKRKIGRRTGFAKRGAKPQAAWEASFVAKFAWARQGRYAIFLEDLATLCALPIWPARLTKFGFPQGRMGNLPVRCFEREQTRTSESPILRCITSSAINSNLKNH